MTANKAFEATHYARASTPPLHGEDSSMAYTYPYTLHGVNVAKMMSPALTGNIHVVRATKSDVDRLRSVYDSLLPDVLSATHCVAFACGGIVYLNYTVSAFCRHFWGHRQIKDVAQLKCCQDRFHLLPSTTWQVSDEGATSNCRSALEGWLRAAHSAPQVMLVDTSFSGGAINNIESVISTIPAAQAVPRDILLCGILDLGRYGKEAPPADRVVPLVGGGRLRIRWLGTPSLISEDIMALLGYSRSKMTTTLQPQWPESVLVLDVDTQNAISFSTCTAAAVFSDLLVDWDARVGRGSTFPTADFCEDEFISEVKRLRAKLS